MRTRHCLALATSAALIVAMLSVGSRADEPQVKVGDKLVALHDTGVQVENEKLATVTAGTELFAEQVNGDWVAVTVDREGKKVSGWIYRPHLIVAPQTAFMKLTVRHPSGIPRAADLFKAWDKDKDDRLTPGEFLAGIQVPTLDDLNGQMGKATSLGGSLSALAELLETVRAFKGWKRPVTLPESNQLLEDFRRTHDIRRSSLAQQLVDREAPQVRAERAQTLFKWADKNHDGKLTVEEFKQALPEGAEKHEREKGD